MKEHGFKVNNMEKENIFCLLDNIEFYFYYLFIINNSYILFIYYVILLVWNMGKW